MSSTKTIEHMSWFIVVFIALLALKGISSAFSADNGYRVESDGNLVQIVTPDGNKTYFLDPALNQISSYSFEVPLSDFKTTPHGSGSDSSSKEGEKAPKQMENTDQLVLKANELYNRGKFKEALAYVEELLMRDPKHVRGWIMKGSLMHVQGQNDLAKEAWQHALDLDPNNSQIKAILGKNQ